MLKLAKQYCQKIAAAMLVVHFIMIAFMLLGWHVHLESAQNAKAVLETIFDQTHKQHVPTDNLKDVLTFSYDKATFAIEALFVQALVCLYIVLCIIGQRLVLTRVGWRYYLESYWYESFYPYTHCRRGPPCLS